MRRLLLAVCVAGLFLLPSHAQTPTFQAVTVDNTSGGVPIPTAILTNSLGETMQYCEARLETAEIRFRDDGGTVTSSSGTLLEPGDVYKAYSNYTAQMVRFIRTGSTSGQLDVRCYLRAPAN